MTNKQKMFIPLETVDKRTKNFILFFWLLGFILAWTYLVPEHSFFPNLPRVLSAWVEMWKAGLFYHIKATLLLTLAAISICIVIASIIAYSSVIPILSPLSDLCTKFRFIPITGFTLFISISTGGGIKMQITLLVIFMAFYFISSLMSMIKDIPEEDFIRRRAERMTPWQILWKVVIMDRLDFLVEAIRLNLSITFVMIVGVESMNKSRGGLGAMLTDNTRGLNFPKVFALALTILVIAFALDFLLKKLFCSFPANKKTE